MDVDFFIFGPNREHLSCFMVCVVTIIWNVSEGSFMWCCLFCGKMLLQLVSQWIKSWRVTIVLKATEQYFHAVMFVS